MSGFVLVIRRDLHLAFRQGFESLMVVAFFVIAVLLFPLGVGPEPNILARILPGVIWVAALLASMLSLERLFQTDYEDGSLELLALQPVAAPLLAVLMNMPADGLWALMAALVIGTLSLSLIGAIGAALILGSRRGGILLSLLVLPLYIPVLIFGASAVDAVLGGFSAKPQLLILSGLLVAALPLCPWAGAAALRQSME